MAHAREQCTGIARPYRGIVLCRSHSPQIDPLCRACTACYARLEDRPLGVWVEEGLKEEIAGGRGPRQASQLFTSESFRVLVALIPRAVLSFTYINPRRTVTCRTRFKTAIAAARPFLGLCPSPLLWLKALDALYNFPAAGKVVGGKPGAR
eukprot:scaffold25885_cov65-Phaeocystis_antarctica.AAC.1